MPKGYCPNCKQVVMTDRADIDIGLAIFLFCCTGSIGFWIYIIIYFLQPEDRCVFCSSKTQPYANQHIQRRNNQQNNNYNHSNQPKNVFSQQSNSQNSYNPPNIAYQEPKPIEQYVPKSQASEMVVDQDTGKIIGTTKKKFCPMCGSPIVPGGKFCKTCGADLRE
ncbi:MAG: hypothetical protein GF364_02700 [Candidatus Lokiarchaeota archaeon]|nr:hypothetical protein [Candidatus Lokiarchaeota archaeon]